MGGYLLVFAGIFSAALSLFFIGAALFVAPTLVMGFITLVSFALWVVVWRQFICLPNKLKTLNADDATAELNAQVSMMMLGAFGGGLFGRLFASEGVMGNIFSLVINDISLGLVLSNFPWGNQMNAKRIFLVSSYIAVFIIILL